MLVILQNEQILSPEKVCQGCLLATQNGFPRWHKDKLSCGQCLSKAKEGKPSIFECQMGFRLANIE